MPRPHSKTLLHLASVLALLAWGMASDPVAGQVTNGGFENGDLAAWTTGGAASVEALQSTALTPAIAPPEGSWFALLSTGPGDVPGDSGGDFDGNATADFDETTLSTTFTLGGPGAVTFEWAFLTSEVGEPNAFDDLFDVTLNGMPILNRSVRMPGGVSPWADSAAYDGTGYTLTGGGVSSGSSYASGTTLFETFCLDIASAGSYTLVFRIADQGDSDGDSGALIDDVRTLATCNPGSLPIAQVTDTTGSSLELKGGAFDFSVVSSSSVTASDNGTVLAFVSSGDFTGDNPNQRDQVFVFSGGGFERLTAAVGGHVGNPEVTSNGRWVVFEASDDLTPGTPGNADGNLEIYHCDRVTGCAATLLQVTDTTSCTNTQPTIGNDGSGRRVAFTTDCTDLTPGFNADGNRETVVWDANGGNFQVNETTGCTSRSPSIARDNSARFISFVSDCDYTGSNADGNFEIFEWTRTNDTYTQATTSTDRFNDSPAASFTGQYVAFLSNGSYGGANPTHQAVSYRWDRSSGSFTLLTAPDPLAADVGIDLDDSGDHVALERLSLVTTTSGIYLVDATSPGVLSTVVASAASVYSALPAVSLTGGTASAAFISDGDFLNRNADGNLEVWSGGAGVSGPRTFTICSTPALPIPDDDPAGVTDALVVTLTGTLSDLDVEVVADHTFVGDLIFTLLHFDTGSTSTLIDRPGYTGSGFGCRRANVDTTLDDEAASPVEDQCANPPPAIDAGPFTPNSPLSAFDGETLSGTWQLTVSDNSAGDSGTLQEWCLNGTYAP